MKKSYVKYSILGTIKHYILDNNNQTFDECILFVDK